MGKLKLLLVVFARQSVHISINRKNIGNDHVHVQGKQQEEMDMCMEMRPGLGLSHINNLIL